tara:strand:- start:5 stop:190 length:186 start_codon:yes stop_codon:yes gene_type:complete
MYRNRRILSSPGRTDERETLLGNQRIVNRLPAGVVATDIKKRVLALMSLPLQQWKARNLLL